jgi:pectate lyase
MQRTFESRRPWTACVTLTASLVLLPALLAEAQDATVVSTNRVEADESNWDDRERSRRRGRVRCDWSNGRLRCRRSAPGPDDRPTPRPAATPAPQPTTPPGPAPVPVPEPSPAPVPAPGDTSAPVGFGADATGGAGGAEYWVTSLADSGPGTLREGAESAQPLNIRFEVSGVINLQSRLDVGSDKTIDGADADVTISNQGFVLSQVSNVVIRNLTFANGRGATTDAIGVRNESHDVWIDHCDFSSYADGTVDITRGGTNVTVSWSRFHDHDKVMLIDGEASDGETVVYSPHVTLHHNLFEDTYQRNPLSRHGLTHTYNNYLHNWGGYAMHVSEDGQLLSEANIFEAGSDTRALLSRAGKNDFAPGLAASIGDWVVNGGLFELRLDSRVFDPSAYYEYTAEPADAALRQRILAGAGVHGAVSDQALD